MTIAVTYTKKSRKNNENSKKMFKKVGSLEKCLNFAHEILHLCLRGVGFFCYSATVLQLVFKSSESKNMVYISIYKYIYI